MQRLPLKLLQPGMVVAKQVVNEKGIVLVSENTELSEKLIARLENMNVSKVAVKGCPVKLGGYAPKSLKERLLEMETAFSRIDPGDELMRKYKVILKAYFIRKDQEMRDGDQEAAPAPTMPSPVDSVASQAASAK